MTNTRVVEMQEAIAHFLGYIIQRLENYDKELDRKTLIEEFASDRFITKYAVTRYFNLLANSSQRPLIWNKPTDTVKLNVEKQDCQIAIGNNRIRMPKKVKT
jgi:hypothetical protein